MTGSGPAQTDWFPQYTSQIFHCECVAYVKYTKICEIICKIHFERNLRLIDLGDAIVASRDVKSHVSDEARPPFDQFYNCVSFRFSTVFNKCPLLPGPKAICLEQFN